MPGIYWTSKELKILRKHYRQSPMAEIAKLLHRTEQAVRMKGSELKLRRLPSLWQDGLRWCNKCRTYKKPDEFHLSAQRRPQQQNQCKSCFAKWFQENKDRFYANGRKHRNKPESKTRRREYNKANATKMEYFKRVHRYSKQYGISVAEYAAMEFRQEGKCAICKQPESFKGKRLSVDHDHENDRVRELLCQRCNLMLGAAFDRPEILENAAQYLKRHKLKETKIS